jgi:asparagine synthase (glutamine-hydrolysing)
VFGSEKKSILAVVERAPALDPVGLLQMFALRHNLGARTFVEGLLFLTPDSWLEYADGRLDVRRAPRLTFHVPVGLRRPATLADEWAEHLRRATVQRLQGKERVVLSLSGGLDSRALACAIPRDWRPFTARTQGRADSLEVRYARDIARRLGLRHVHEDPEALPLSTVLPKVVWRTEGAIPFINAATMGRHAGVKQHGDFLMAGQLGGPLSGGRLYPFMFRPRSRRQFLDAVYRWYRPGPPGTLTQLFNADFLRTQEPAVYQSFLDSFQAIDADSNPQAFELWDLYERQVRLSLCAAPVDTFLFEHVRPFLDRQHIDFVLSLPAWLRYGQTLYQTMIYRLGPEVRDVPNANNNARLARTVGGGMLQRAGLLTRKAARRWFGGPRPRPGSDDPIDVTGQSRQDAGLRRLLEEFVSRPGFDDAVFNRAGIQAMLNAHYRAEVDYSRPLCLLATMAVAGDYFLARRPTVCPPEAEPLDEVVLPAQAEA